MRISTISTPLRFNISGYCASAGEVGGDICDVLQIAPGAVLLVVADVMGKGASAARFAAKLRALVRAIAKPFPDPAELLMEINHLMYGELSEAGVFITAQVAKADAIAGQLTVVSAGHCPLLAARGDGTADAYAPDGMPLGIVPEQTFMPTTIPLGHSSSALLHTDGLSEARNARGELLGNEYLREWLGQSAARRHTASAMAGHLLSELQRFRSSAPPQDDQAFLLLTASADQSRFHHSSRPVPRRQTPHSALLPKGDTQPSDRATSGSEFGFRPSDFEIDGAAYGLEGPADVMTAE